MNVVREILDLLEIEASKDLKDPKDLEVLQEKLESLVYPALSHLKDLLDHLDQEVFLEGQELMVQQDLKDLKDFLGMPLVLYWPNNCVITILQGSKGARGVPGQEGPKGPSGPAGAHGAQGKQGPPGSSVSNSTGDLFQYCLVYIYSCLSITSSDKSLE